MGSVQNIVWQENNLDDTRSSLIGDLARVADQALALGEYRRCVAIIESIYDLLERRTWDEADADEMAVGRIISSLEPDLTPSPFCLGIPF